MLLNKSNRKMILKIVIVATLFLLLGFKLGMNFSHWFIFTYLDSNQQSNRPLLAQWLCKHYKHLR